MKLVRTDTYCKARETLVGVFQKTKGSAKRIYYLNGDGGIKMKELYPTKGWKSRRILAPDEWRSL